MTALRCRILGHKHPNEHDWQKHKSARWNATEPRRRRYGDPRLNREGKERFMQHCARCGEWVGGRFG